MPKFNVRVRQTLKVTRECIVEVERADMASAVEEFASGNTEAPAYHDPVWVSYTDLQDEEFASATTEDVKRVALGLKDEAALLAHFAAVKARSGASA